MDDASTTSDAGEPDAGMTVDCTGRPVESPDTRGETHGVFDLARNRIVAYGGDTSAPEMCFPQYTYVSELWAFHLDCNNWERIDAPGGPGPRGRFATAVDSDGGRMFFFGGRIKNAGGGYTSFDDVWALDLATDSWSDITPAAPGPSARSSAVMAYDPGSDRLLVFGGNVSNDPLVLTGVGDTWALDIATGTWSEITAADAPSARLYHAATVMNGAMYVFGGTPDFDGPYYNDVHAFDMATDTWTQVAGGGPDAPVTRFGAGLFADSERNRLVMAFGHDATSMGNRNDMHAVDVGSGAWTELHPGDVYNGGSTGFCMFPPDFTTPEDGAPERRYSFLYADGEGRGYAFAGKTDCGNTNDVWAIDYATNAWEQLRPATGGIACNRSGATTCSMLCF